MSDDEDDGPSNPKHMNGCTACPEPRNRKGADIYWFPNGAAYLELCRAHWQEIRAFLNGEKPPAREPLVKSAVTLEAFS